MTNDISRPVAVLGLGPMGVALTDALAAHGLRTIVWNRTPRAHALRPSTLIEVATTAADAAARAGLVIVCVRDHDASRRVLDDIAPYAGSAVVVNVSTGTPAEARASAEHAATRGVRYVTGAIMVPTPLIGTAESLVIYAGAARDIAALDALFAALGGESEVVGDDHAVPPVLDLAMLDIYFAGMYAHLHATALAAAHGVAPGRFLPYARSVVDTLGASLPDLTHAVERRRYDSGQARVDMCLAFLQKIVDSSRDAGIPPGVAEVVRSASERARDRWPGDTDWDVVAEELLAPRSAPVPR